MIVLGADPGSNLGVVVLTMPENWVIMNAHWYGNAVIASKTSKTTPTAVTDEAYFRRVYDLFAKFRGSTLVMENPADAAAYWGAQDQKGHARGTLMRLGTYKGLVFGAAVAAGLVIIEYTVRGKKTAPGWMLGKGKRPKILQDMQLLARAIGGPPNLQDHELMALGVLNHHAGLQQQTSLLSRASGIS